VKTTQLDQFWFGEAETGLQHLNTHMGKLLIAPAKAVFTVRKYSYTQPPGNESCLFFCFFEVLQFSVYEVVFFALRYSTLKSNLALLKWLPGGFARIDR
jgi:hypothetical protein